MTADLRTLYQEVILDHNKKPRNHGVLEHPNRRAEGVNPLCGDHIELTLDLTGDTIEAIAFQGESCAICKASASMMTVAIKGKHRDAAQTMIHEFTALATGRAGADACPNIGRLASIFAGISELPMRVKCAILPWHTLQAALNAVATTTTEAEGDPMQMPLGDS